MTVQLGLLTRSTFLSDFDKWSDLTDAALAKQATKRNIPNQPHWSCSNFLSAKRPDKTLNVFYQVYPSYLTNPIGGRT
jgi:hypothetical protein